MKAWLIERLQPLRRWLPFIPVEQKVATKKAGVIHPAEASRLWQQKREALPSALQSAFTLEPLAGGDDRFVGRQSVIDHIDQAIAEWHAGNASLTVVTAPHGAGLTSFFNQVRSNLSSTDSILFLSLAIRPLSVEQSLSIFSTVFRLPQTVYSVDEMIEQLNARPRSVVIIDDGHMLLARQMGAMEAFDAFLAVLLGTQQRHCWILGCAQQAWRRLNFLHQVDRFVNRHLVLEYFSDQELTDAIDRRIARTGFSWQKREGLTEEDSDPLPALLKPLYQRSEGHMELALFLLANVLQINDEQRLECDEWPSFDTKEIGNCDTDEQFTLAEIYLHGVLSEQEHQRIFRVSAAQSVLSLQRLHQVGLLQLIRSPDVDGGNRYRLAPILAQAMVAQLLNSNRLY